MKSNLPNFSLNLCFCYPPERKVIVLLPTVGLGCNTYQVVSRQGWCWIALLCSYAKYVGVCFSPREARVLITPGNIFMLGNKGHECFLSPLQLGVRLKYAGGGEKSFQQKALLACFSWGSQSVQHRSHHRFCPCSGPRGADFLLWRLNTAISGSCCLSPLLWVGDLR